MQWSVACAAALPFYRRGTGRDASPSVPAAARVRRAGARGPAGSRVRPLPSAGPARVWRVNRFARSGSHSPLSIVFRSSSAHSGPAGPARCPSTSSSTVKFPSLSQVPRPLQPAYTRQPRPLDTRRGDVSARNRRASRRGRVRRDVNARQPRDAADVVWAVAVTTHVADSVVSLEHAFRALVRDPGDGTCRSTHQHARACTARKGSNAALSLHATGTRRQQMSARVDCESWVLGPQGGVFALTYKESVASSVPLYCRRASTL